LRQIIKPEILARYQVEVQKIFGDNRGFTLLLCFQRDFFDLKLLCETQGNTKTGKLETVTFFALQQVINDHLSTGLSSFAPIWASFLEMTLTLQDLQQANVLCETRIWDPLDACSDLSFPSATILHGKIDEIASLKTSIGKCLTVTVAEQSFPLLDLLTEYHC
jgi:hypothetical protein